MIASLESVSIVTWFDEDTPICRVLETMPNVFIKGGVWAIDKIVGGKEVLANGGKVLSIPFIHQTSTTAILGKIRSL